MSSLVGQRVLLVGVSSGIGAALAEELHERGAIVAVSARRADRLDELSRGRFATVPVDVTDHAAVLEGARQVGETIGPIDTVVWCAGYWHTFDATDWQAEEFARHVEVNLLGLGHVVDATVPEMVARGRGHLPRLVEAVTDHQPVPVLIHRTGVSVDVGGDLGAQCRGEPRVDAEVAELLDTVTPTADA